MYKPLTQESRSPCISHAMAVLLYIVLYFNVPSLPHALSLGNLHYAAIGYALQCLHDSWWTFYRSVVESMSREKREAAGQPPAYADKSAHQLTDGLNEVKQIVKQMHTDAISKNKVRLTARSCECES